MKSIEYKHDHYQSRVVWLKKQKIVGLCGYASDGKCFVNYGWNLRKFGIYWDANLIALSPKLPYCIVSFLVYEKWRLTLNKLKRIMTRFKEFLIVVGER